MAFFVPGVGAKRFYRFSLIHLRECSPLSRNTASFYHLPYRQVTSASGRVFFILFLFYDYRVPSSTWIRIRMRVFCTKWFSSSVVGRFSFTLFRYGMIMMVYTVLRAQVSTRKHGFFLQKCLMNIDAHAEIVIRQQLYIIPVDEYDLEKNKLNFSPFLRWINSWRTSYGATVNVERARIMFWRVPNRSRCMPQTRPPMYDSYFLRLVP
jgi:hypothetical protein